MKESILACVPKLALTGNPKLSKTSLNLSSFNGRTVIITIPRTITQSNLPFIFKKKNQLYGLFTKLADIKTAIKCIKLFPKPQTDRRQTLLDVFHFASELRACDEAHFFSTTCWSVEFL